MTFLHIRLIDIVDIFIVAFLMFRIYKLIKGTVALNILIGMFAFLLVWIVIKALHMQLSSSILDNFVNVGVLALIIVFQQEIRRFLLLIGSKYNISHKFTMDKFFASSGRGMLDIYIKPVVRAYDYFSQTKTGALIVITKDSELLDYVQTGELINGVISTRLIETIFFKNGPLHDGAVIISGNKIKAAGCILPVSQTMSLPEEAGLRHRAALGITEATDAISIVVSEETGKISLFSKGEMEMGLSPEELSKRLSEINK